MKRSYAVIWSTGEGIGSGRLEPRADRFELYGRSRPSSILFADLAGVSIARGPADRLRGLPVLMLLPRRGASTRIASLEGTGVLYELVQQVERSGLTVAA